MKTTSIIFLACLALSGCVSTTAQNRQSVGRFVLAGPTNADVPEFAMRWKYSLQLSIDLSSISEVQFTCAPIPGTSFVAKKSDLKNLGNGALTVDGPVLLISKETTPWLYENTTTSANCQAVILRANQADSLVSAPVSFSPSTKTATLQQFKTAHDYNSRLKR